MCEAWHAVSEHALAQQDAGHLDEILVAALEDGNPPAAMRIARILRARDVAAANTALRAIDPDGGGPAAAAVYIALYGVDRLPELFATLLDLRGGEDRLIALAAALCHHNCPGAGGVPEWDVWLPLSPPAPDDVAPGDWGRFAELRTRATVAATHRPALRPALVCLAARWPILTIADLLAPDVQHLPAAPLAAYRLACLGRITDDDDIPAWPAHGLWPCVQYHATGELTTGGPSILIPLRVHR